MLIEVLLLSRYVQCTSASLHVLLARACTACDTPDSLYPTAGVHSVVVALLSEKAEIQYNPEQTDPEKLVRDISSLGFGANLIADQNGHQQGKINLIVSGFFELSNVID